MLTILSSLSVVSSLLFVVCFYLLLKRMSLSRIDEEMRRRAKEMMEECSLYRIVGSAIESKED